jgi:sulfate permease, SulP family
MAAATLKPSFAELYTPKLFTILREGYGLASLKADTISGLTVAIVALPLSMAIAIASGVTPDRGLYASIIAGFIVSALGGSRFQIGGPAGAFIVLVSATVAQHGVDGLLLATFLSGFMLAAVGLLRLGTFIKYIPYPVTVGFTAGIAVIIFASQIKDLLGLSLDKEPGPLLPKLQAIGSALPTANPPAILVAAVTIGIIVAIRRFSTALAILHHCGGDCRRRHRADWPSGRDDRDALRRHPADAADTQSAGGVLCEGD